MDCRFSKMKVDITAKVCTCVRCKDHNACQSQTLTSLVSSCTLCPQSVSDVPFFYNSQTTLTPFVLGLQGPRNFPRSVLDELAVDSSTPLSDIVVTSGFTNPNPNPNPLLRISLAALPRSAYDGGMYIGCRQCMHNSPPW